MLEQASHSIRTMRAGNLPFAAACTAGEGWVSEDLATLEGFYAYDPLGCFVAEAGGLQIGICIATSYGRSGFIGELIVHPERRGKGVGAALLTHAVNYLHTRGAKTIYLDGVLKAVDLYERNGFQKVCRSWRFSGQPNGRSSPFIRRMETSDLDDVAALDKAAFGEERSFFLHRRLTLFPTLGYVLVEKGKVAGYILGREGEKWISAGPMVTHTESAHAEDLLLAFALQARGRPVSVGILDANPTAFGLVRSLGFEPRTDSPWRMAAGEKKGLGASPACYAIGSAAKG